MEKCTYINQENFSLNEEMNSIPGFLLVTSALADKMATRVASLAVPLYKNI